jgi:mono/diheme cytochrome c family protein
MSRGVVVLVAFALVACDVDRPWPALEPSLERMMVQPHAEPYEAADAFANHSAMRSPPRGTEPYAGSAPELAAPVADIALLRRGQEAFETVCATCHGILGDGDTPIAERMTLRRPPSLHEPRIRAFTPDRIYAVITQGYGLMPTYAAELPESERWAVTRYVRALQLSYAVDLDSLDPLTRVEAEKALR